MTKIEEKRKQIESELDRRKTKRRRDDDEFKVVEGVIDGPTLKVLYKLLNRGSIDKLHGSISTGKEANVYRGEDADGTPVAVKIYRMSTAETDWMREYIVGDPRFKKVGRRTRSLIPKWALKEYKNLKRYLEAGIPAPEPIDIERNVLVMEFIGDSDTGLPAPLLRNIEVPSPLDTFNEIMTMIEDGYKDAGLVHGDLSEYNILWSDRPVFIDVSQAVLIGHERSTQYLLRDIHNITRYFRRLGVDAEDPRVITKDILQSGDE